MASSMTVTTEIANHFHLARHNLMNSPIVSVLLFAMIVYLKISTATVVSTEMAESQNEALVISLALAVDWRFL